ncbi:hypothetical protein OGW03_05230 [Citrobacter sp. Cf079]|uniref:hypothetical protein n=1 Tax=Citrobacter TaxID=544 RepID=UPI00257892D0|nr:hypothetical protein [Citrobacter sp. Cf079]MDM3235097.1 hypothetical protein [Citrobacter sp. Cf079]
MKKQVWYTILHMAWYTPKARRSKAFGKALYNAWGVTLFLGLTLPSNPTYLVFSCLNFASGQLTTLGINIQVEHYDREWVFTSSTTAEI